MIEVQKNIRLSQKTFYGIGGIANEFYEIDDIKCLDELWAETISLNIPKIILGKGSNMVFADKGFVGRVFFPTFNKIKWISKKDGIVSVESGCSFQKFIEETNKLGFEDLCNLSGIPGNVGGFIRGNAGAYGIETSDNIIAIEYLDENGDLQKISKDKAKFIYRGSLFKQNPDLFVIKAIFQLNKKEKPQIALENTKNLLKTRWEKYPAGRSGGCVFKNPKGQIAGKLLDELGAKGDCIGGIEIADNHANFFINKGNATQKDILDMISKWQKIVFEKHQIRLQPEIYVIDEFGSTLQLDKLHQ